MATTGLWVGTHNDRQRRAIELAAKSFATLMKTRAYITVPHDRVLVHAASTVALSARLGLAQIEGTLPWESTRDMMAKEKSAATLEACRYLYASPHVNCFPDREAYARISYTPGRPQLDAALELTHRIFDVARGGAARPVRRLPGFRPTDDRLPARYMSGYILTHPPAGKPRPIGADASHAWVSMFCRALGWVDFDSTTSA